MSTTAAKCCAFAALLLLAAGARAQILSAQLGLVVNDADPSSVAVAEYYRQARGIAERQVAHVRLPGPPRKLDAAAFAAMKQEVDRQLGPDIHAVLFVWTAPYAVECNGLTAAYTLGFDAGQCRQPCASGRPNPYFDRNELPQGMRLSMLLPTMPEALARAVVDRGKVAGFGTPQAGAYFLQTGDKLRDVRAVFFPPSAKVPARRLQIHTLRQAALEGADDIILYQTGAAQVDKLETLHFLPGALADHLTSWGGDLLGSTQMSSLRWLQAGATASYGTVSEPCSHWQKFPHPAILLRHYLGGATAIEAYWRSVLWPAQGVFIGEPLARPYQH